jgi:FixJ family two-component response regulator
MHTTLGVVAIAEDDTAMRRSLERLLQASGYTTTAFASAEEFLERAIVDQAIGLVLDIHLGGMSGIELRRRLLAAKSPLPIVFITAHEDEATRREALAAGCVDYLHKPFNADRLLEALARGRKP